PARVRGRGQRRERLVAAEQRVDPGERRRVVAVVRPGREERRQVEDVGAEGRDVVEVLLDPAQVAAEELGGGLRRAPLRQRVPLAAHRPLGRLHCQPARGEAVREDLVHDRARMPVGPPRARRGDEVVRVRDVVADPPPAVHPREARLAAPEQPAVADRRAGRRERRSPPGLAAGLRVDDRLDRARLAVVHGAQDHAVGGAARRAQPDDAALARVVELELRPVVVRLAEQVPHAADVGNRHPLTDPAVSPLTIQRWSTKKSAATGTAAISVPAVNGPQVWSYWLLTSWFIPTGRVKFPFVWSRAEAITNSLSVNTNEISATTQSTGAARGSTTPQKICAGVAPSTRADSSSSAGIVSKNPFISHA